MSNPPFVLERTLKAPRALVWAAFSTAEYDGIALHDSRRRLD